VPIFEIRLLCKYLRLGLCMTLSGSGDIVRIMHLNQSVICLIIHLEFLLTSVFRFKSERLISRPRA
jgi:hypothetical protein